ncbi:glutaredoxin family protein [Litchfieldella rifensis]|uniref:Glutaredoxin family protein n=1 Tax=Litchfieldella rifensis TaxID=762643 RepID=A0ABV7LJ23_9GAMM
MIRLTLYTTLGCHLCDELEHHLASLSVAEVMLERIEIADDDALMARYGERIPVLVDADGVELERGFEPECLAAWLAERGWLHEGAVETAEAQASQPKRAYLRHGRRFLGQRDPTR